MTYLLGGRLLKQVACLKGCSAKKLSLLKNYPFSVWKGLPEPFASERADVTWTCSTPEQRAENMPEEVWREENAANICSRMHISILQVFWWGGGRCRQGLRAGIRSSRQDKDSFAHVMHRSKRNFLWNDVLISVQRVINFNYIMLLFPNFHYKQFKCVPKSSKLKQSSNKACYGYNGGVHTSSYYNNQTV